MVNVRASRSIKIYQVPVRHQPQQLKLGSVVHIWEKIDNQILATKVPYEAGSHTEWISCQDMKQPWNEQHCDEIDTASRMILGSYCITSLEGNIIVLSTFYVYVIFV